MKEISNNTLGMLVALSLVVSLAGVWVLLNQPTFPITGLITNPSGNVSITVTSATSISMLATPLDYSASLYDIQRPTTGGTSNDTQDDNPLPLVVLNDGTDPVNITIAATSFAFSSATSNASFCINYNTSCWEVRAPAENSSFKMLYNNTYGWVGIRSGRTATDADIYYLNYTDTTDTVLIDLNVTIAWDETAGQKQSMLTFTATAVTE
ncbi:hypothetical protein COU36_02420 [Candidatus Micrarchaeota archaeon CG10_big_fil_rev_8_21_14_0_10_59_7]|nr:MAG: hypothetical protein COU36_02420 [Candidatus Micrarchaeota archaeon CG10_big_fil_rev_8_21_14_0_10_59_7]